MTTPIGVINTDRMSGMFAPAFDPAESAPLGVKLVCAFYVLALIPLTYQVLSLYPLMIYGWFVGEGRLVLLALATGLTLVVTGLLILLVGVIYGLWTVRPWAWVIFFALTAISLVGSLVSLELIPFLIGLVILWYFWSVRSYYGYGTPT